MKEPVGNELSLTGHKKPLENDTASDWLVWKWEIHENSAATLPD